MSPNITVDDADGIDNFAATSNVVRFRRYISLKNLVRRMEQIDSLGGTIGFDIPIEVLSHQFDVVSLHEDENNQLQEVELEQAEIGIFSSIVLRTPIGQSGRLEVFAEDVSGNPIMVEKGVLIVSSFMNCERTNWRIHGMPTTVEVQQFRTTDVAFQYGDEQRDLGACI